MLPPCSKTKFTIDYDSFPSLSFRLVIADWSHTLLQLKHGADVTCTNPPQYDIDKLPPGAPLVSPPPTTNPETQRSLREAGHVNPSAALARARRTIYLPHLITNSVLSCSPMKPPAHRALHLSLPFPRAPRSPKGKPMSSYLLTLRDRLGRSQRILLTFTRPLAASPVLIRKVSRRGSNERRGHCCPCRPGPNRRHLRCRCCVLWACLLCP